MISEAGLVSVSRRSGLPACPTAAGRSRVRRLLPAAALLLLALWPVALFAQTTGQVTGTVLDDRSGKPLAYTNVQVVGTSLGAITDAEGKYTINGVPVGAQTLQASYLGFEMQKLPLTVTPGVTAHLDFRMKETIAKKEKEILITAERPLVEVDKAATTRSYNQEELKRLTVQPTLESVVEQQPGVTKDKNQIHIRGGRSDETLFIIDGVKQRDVLTGESNGTNVSARSVAEVNIITGGFDAKYGQALSGVVDAQLKEGTDEFHGYLGYQTDRLTNDWKTDLLNLQLSGKLPLFTTLLHTLGVDHPGKATCFMDLSSDLADGYYPSIRDFNGDATRRASLGESSQIGRRLISSYKDSFLGLTGRYGQFFTPRENNAWRLLFKSAWRINDKNKVNFSVTKSLSIDQGFNEVAIGDINRNQTTYPWAWTHRLDHYYTVTADRNSFSMSWNHSFNPNFISILNLTRYYTGNHRDVGGKLYSQYDLSQDSKLPTALQSLDLPYFRNVGDASDFSDRFVQTWAVNSDWIRKWGRHDIRWGLSSQYESVQYLTIDTSTIDSLNTLGTAHDLFHVYPNTGAAYLQDRVEYEGLIGSLGLRYDYWFPGQQVEKLYENPPRDPERSDLYLNPLITPATRAEFYRDTNSLFGHRFKGHLSPRIQVSYPITSRDNMFFNYGHFTQRPPYYYVYTRSGSLTTSEFPRIGNPNLNPEISVQYELGGGHQFSSDMAVKLSLFYKDIYDYPTSISYTLEQRDYLIYRNIDYARSRGIELELRKRRSEHASWSVAYSYSVAKGKSSDPNALALIQASGGDARQTSLGEQFMWWNRPHKLTVWYDYRINRGERRPRLFGFRLPEDTSVNLYYLLQSGMAYTPKDVNGNQTGQDYSRNGPLEIALNGTLTKAFYLVGRKWEFTLQGWNLLDNRTLMDFDPSTGKAWKPGQGSLNAFTQNPANLSLSDDELYRLSGQNLSPGQTVAQLATDIRNRILSTIYQYQNPAFRAVPRNFRLGISMEW